MEVLSRNKRNQPDVLVREKDGTTLHLRLGAAAARAAASFDDALQDAILVAAARYASEHPLSNDGRIYDRPFEHAFLGVGKGAEVARLGQVTRVCSTVDGEPHSAGIPEGTFLVSDVDRFEALVVLRARNVNEPKRDFAS